jgi:hypothetical protein
MIFSKEDNAGIDSNELKILPSLRDLYLVKQ